jgi:hypothetical protein
MKSNDNNEPRIISCHGAALRTFYYIFILEMGCHPATERHLYTTKAWNNTRPTDTEIHQYIIILIHTQFRGVRM